jgi:hypothetical protein
MLLVSVNYTGVGARFQRRKPARIRPATLLMATPKLPTGKDLVQVAWMALDCCQEHTIIF